jgi:hypothetical protein
MIITDVQNIILVNQDNVNMIVNIIVNVIVKAIQKIRVEKKKP